MNQRSLISIILPAHNEGQILYDTLKHLSKMSLQLPRCEILVIENGSKDKTLEIAKQFAKKFPQIKVESLKDPSYGQALRRGIEIASGDNIVFFNVDFYDFDFVIRAIKLLDSFDIVTGSKNLKDSLDLRPLLRRIITKSFNFILKLIFDFKGTDVHGIKVFKKEKIIPVLSLCKTDGELFDAELILRGQKNGLRTCELAISVKEKRPSRYSLISRFVPTLVDLLKLTPLVSPHPFIKYCMVGVSNTIVDWSSYLLLTRLSNFWLLHFLWAKTISFIFGTINSYIFNRLWTFKSKDNQIARQFLRFSLVNTFALGLNVGTMYVTVERLKLPDLIGLIFATFISLAFGFSLNRYWTFREKVRV